MRCIDFDDHKVALAAGDSGLILKTTNGGETWKEQCKRVFGNLKLVAVLNKDTALASGDNYMLPHHHASKVSKILFERSEFILD